MKKHKYNFVYKTTNNLNGDYYIGVHSTDDLDDGYMGSGKRITRSINKYGVENFSRTIIKFFDCTKDAYLLEAEIVTPELISDPHCLNLVVGGHGGYITAGYTDVQRQEHCSKISNGRKGITAWNKGLTRQTDERVAKYGDKRIGSHLPSEACKKISDAAKQRTGERNGMYGKHHSEETRKKQSELKKGKTTWAKGKKFSKEHCKHISESHKGEKHPMYGKHHPEQTKRKQSQAKIGTRAINNGKILRFVKLSEIDLFLNNGWQLGYLKKK